MDRFSSKIFKEMENAFFEVMAKGWVAGSKPVKSVEFPGFDTFSGEHDGFRVVDCFYYNKIGKGFGQTIISHNTFGGGLPLWQMTYFGIYSEIAIPFLKEVLLSAYLAKEFLGGRGSVKHEKDSLIYINHPEESSFAKFQGEERISDILNLCIGWHEYRGMSLLL